MSETRLGGDWHRSNIIFEEDTEACFSTNPEISGNDHLFMNEIARKRFQIFVNYIASVSSETNLSSLIFLDAGISDAADSLNVLITSSSRFDGALLNCQEIKFGSRRIMETNDGGTIWQESSGRMKTLPSVAASTDFIACFGSFYKHCAAASLANSLETPGIYAFPAQ